MTRPSLTRPALRTWPLAALAATGVVIAAACSEPAPPVPPAVVVQAEKSDQERVKFYQDCWTLFNNKDWDRFGQCYTENALSEDVDATPPSATGRAAIVARDKQLAEAFPDRKGELQLVLGHGAHVLGIAIYTGTNTGPMPGPDGTPVPATNRKIGFYMAHTVDFDPTGAMAARAAGYVEAGTMMGQLGLSKNSVRPVIAPTGAPAKVVIGTGDEKEMNNLAVVQAMIAAENKHDQKSITDRLADDYKLMEIAMPADADKKKAVANTKEFFGAFADLTMTASSTWTAGDYVVLEGTVAGTNTGDMPSMGVKKTGRKMQIRFIEVMKIAGGKIQEDWLFYNGAAFAAQLGMQ